MADNLTNTDANTTQYITAKNFEGLKTDLNNAFNKVVSNNFYKGAKGDSVKITRVSLKDSDNTLTTEGEKVYTVIFGDGADITDKHVAAIPTEWVGHPATPLFFVYHETTDDDVFTDYSCIIYATEMTDAGGYAYSKVDGFPTIYYNRTLKDYCWKVSGTETEITARYKDTSDKSVQFFLLKKITDTEFKYWDAEGNKWVDNLTSQTPTIGDYAYVLFKKTVSVAEVNTDVLALGFAIYNSDGWKEIAYGDDLTAVTYNDAYMSYIWNTIYTSLGQEYPAEPISADMDETIDPNKSFHLPDVTTDGEYFHNITAISNSDRSDIVVSPKDYGNTSKEYAVIFDGYEGVYTKGRDTGPDDKYKLVTKTELDDAAAYIDLNQDDYTAANTYKKVKVISDSYPDMVIYMDLTAKPEKTLMYMPLPGIAVINNELFDVRYIITTDTITWMKDQYGNEATWDFVHEKTFIYNGGGDDLDCRSHFRNTVFKGTRGTRGMSIYIKNAYTGSPTTIPIPSAYAIGKNNVFDNCMTTKGPSTLTVCVDSTQSAFPNIIISNNVITNSKLNITLGIDSSSDELIYNLHNSESDDLARCVFNNNVITNSEVTLSAYRMADNTIINSTISGINTAWLYLQQSALGTSTTKPTYAGCDYDNNSSSDVKYQRQIKYVYGQSGPTFVSSALYNLRSIDHNKFIGVISNVPLVFIAKNVSSYKDTQVTSFLSNDIYTVRSVLTSNFKRVINFNHDLSYVSFSGDNTYDPVNLLTDLGVEDTYDTMSTPRIYIDNGSTDGIEIAVIGFANVKSAIVTKTDTDDLQISDYLMLNGSIVTATGERIYTVRKNTYDDVLVNIRGSKSTKDNGVGIVDLIIGGYICTQGNMIHMASYKAVKTGLSILQSS